MTNAEKRPAFVSRLGVHYWMPAFAGMTATDWIVRHLSLRYRPSGLLEREFDLNFPSIRS